MSRILGQYRQTAEIGFSERHFTHPCSRKEVAIFLLIVCALAGPVCPEETSPQDSPATQQLAAKIEIPIHLDDNLVIVKAIVAGQRNVNMILDTGTSPSSITKALADTLKLPRDVTALRSLNGTIRAESVVLPAVDFGPLHTAPLRVIVQDLSFVERNLGIRLGGIIGLDILTKSSFTIDYQRKSITFGALPPGLKTVAFAATSPSLTVYAKIDGQKVRLLIDSGTEGLVLYRNRVTAMPAAPHFDRSASISTISGSNRLSWLKTRVSIGEEDLGKREIAIADIDSNFGDEFDGLMGFAQMGFHRVGFDFENGRFGWD